MIVGTGVALSALTGCLGSDDRTALSEQPPGNDVEDGIRTAIGESNTAADQLRAAREGAQSPADVTFDEAALGDRIADARSTLETTSQAEAAGEYQAELDAASAYVDVVEGLLDASSSLTGVASRLQTLQSNFQNENYDAEQTLSEVEPTVETAGGTITEAESTARNIDAALLDPYGEKLERLTEGIATVQNGVAGADELIVGYQAVLTGRDRLEAGRTAIEQRNLSRAASEFEAARTEFETATGRFEEARSVTDGELSTYVDAALCRSGALTDASIHFEDAASAAQQFDVTEAEQQRQEGRADLEAARNCGT